MCVCMLCNNVHSVQSHLTHTTSKGQTSIKNSIPFTRRNNRWLSLLYFFFSLSSLPTLFFLLSFFLFSLSSLPSSSSPSLFFVDHPSSSLSLTPLSLHPPLITFLPLTENQNTTANKDTTPKSNIPERNTQPWSQRPSLLHLHKATATSETTTLEWTPPPQLSIHPQYNPWRHTPW